MADFATWVAACEPALWSVGTFWSAYCANIDEAVEGVIDADLVADAIRTMMNQQSEWTGTAKELLKVLADIVGERGTKSKSWRETPEALRGRLRRLAPNLRKIGINIAFPEKNARPRNIRITKAARRPEDQGAQPSEPSEPSAPTPKSNIDENLEEPEQATVTGQSDGLKEEPQTVGPTVGGNPLKSNVSDSSDGRDGKGPGHSASEKPQWSERL
jgi:hypothetical protein